MKRRSEFDLERMKIYMALPAAEKLAYLQEASRFFARFRNPATDKLGKELKRRGF